MGKHIALFFSLMVIMAAVAMPTEARRKGRLNCAAKGTKGAGCNSNVSFFKRLLEEKFRENGLDKTPYEEDAAERGDEEFEVKMRLLSELLRELAPESDERQ